ncbi:DUF445 domain-containing protein [Clostridium sp.]|uniref:DUF445 domain-containing protein n=1 Tax=Clostridium sp. TaxID=1506 RepID=UPI0025851141|nr:DUF445 domain-containing protein [Clostridium sp.]MDF2503639.1 putative rane protein [Clostridium sp.]
MNYKNKANITLLSVFIVFIIIASLKYYYGNFMILNFCFMVMEASVIGGVADWFAITAIFSKPLGISYHTEIIPRNREKIIDGICNMVEKELLTSDIISEKILQIKIVEKLIIFMENRKNKILTYIENNLNDYFTHNGKEKVMYIYNNVLKDNLDKFSVTDNIKSMATKIKGTEQEDKIIDYIIENFIKLSEKDSTRNLIYKTLLSIKEKKVNNFFSRISFSIFEKTDSVNLLSAADNIQKGIVESLIEMKYNDNNMRVRFKEEVREYLFSIENHREEIEAFKVKLAKEVDIKAIVESITSLKEVNGREISILSHWITEQLDFCFERFNENDNLKKYIENIFKHIFIGFAEKEHRFIGTLVRETLSEFDDKKLNEFIESKFGEDLQWIRINGSVVGGIIGALMFIFLRLLYDPYVVPAIRKIFV